MDEEGHILKFGDCVCLSPSSLTSGKEGSLGFMSSGGLFDERLWVERLDGANIPVCNVFCLLNSYLMTLRTA